jgi:hypothetical protein
VAIDPRSAPGETRVLVIPEACGAAIAVRPSDGCASLYTPGGAPAALPEVGAGEPRALEVSGRFITVAGEHGLLLESPRAP